MPTYPNHPPATPHPTARRRLCVIASTLAVVLALCGLSAAGASAAAAELPAPTRASAAQTSTPSIRSGTSSNRSYWCVPDVSRTGTSSRIGLDDQDRDDYDDADYDNDDADLTELVDLVDDDCAGRGRRDRDSTVWLDSGRGGQWPLDLSSLGIQVRVGTPTGENRYAAGPSRQLTRSDPGKLRCRVTPSSQTRTDRDNQRWACVATDSDTQQPRSRGSSLDRPTNRTGGPIIIMRDNRPGNDWSDERLSPGDRDWWPQALPDERPRLLMPSPSRSNSSTPAAGNRRCLVMYSGEDGVEVQIGQLSKVSPSR